MKKKRAEDLLKLFYSALLPMDSGPWLAAYCLVQAQLKHPTDLEAALDLACAMAREDETFHPAIPVLQGLR